MGTIAKTDIELVEASRRGEVDAFGHLVARYQDIVCAVSYSSTCDRGLSEDVAQDTFVAAWRQLDRLRDTARLRPWLCGIARNLARKARRRTRREELVETDDLAGEQTPFDDAARADVERVVRTALAQMPATYREVLVLYYCEDQSIREVAATLDTSEAAVMQRLSRGRRYLAQNVTELVERTLGERRRPRRDLVAAVLAAIAVYTLPSRVDASPTKGSTMLKLTLAATALTAAGTTAYLVRGSDTASASPQKTATAQLHYGAARPVAAPHLPAVTPRTAAARVAAVDDLSFLPANSDAVIVVNFDQLKQSGLWKKYAAPKVAERPVLKEVAALCGYDPIASLQSLSIGLHGLETGSPSGVIVVHGIDKAKGMACFDKRGVPHVEKDGSKVTIDGDVVAITGKDGHSGGFTFVNDTTMVAVFGPEAETTDGIRKIAAGGGGSIASSRAFADKLANINNEDTVWLVLDETSPAMRHANAAIAAKGEHMKVQAFYGSINITDGLEVDARLRLDSKDAVAGLVAKIQAAMLIPKAHDIIQQYFDRIDVMADGADVWVNLAISGDQLAQFVGQHVR